MKTSSLRTLAILLFASAVNTNSISAQAGKGWTNLIKGNTLQGWKKMGGKASFANENGILTGTAVSDSMNTFLVSEKEYGDFVLELDVMVESPSGNSGVQTRSHNHGNKVYGRQVEVDPSSRQWSGGVYDEGRRDWLYPMELHAEAKSAFKPGEYNHIKVECIGDEMKTWINDVPCAYVVDTVDRKGFIALQAHAAGDANAVGKKVFFKNIRIKTTGIQPTPFPAGVYVLNTKPNDLTPYERNSGWQLLFDGHSSKGWISAKGDQFPAKGWVVDNGTMEVLSSQGKEAANGGDIITEKQFKAFDLSFQFKLTPGANSGVKYFVTLKEKSSGSAIGLEYQVLDDALHPDAKLGVNGNRTLASLYDLITAKKQSRFTHAIGEWNTGRVIVYPNNHVEHYLNGIKVLEYERGSAEYRELVSKSKYHIWENFGEAEQGHILLQDHGDNVFFRSIKIKEL